MHEMSTCSLCMLRFILLAVVSFTFLGSGIAAIVVPDDQPSIAQAIAAATDGDSILLRGGVYFEHSLVIAKSLYISGESGSRSNVVIDARSEGRIFFGEYGDWVFRLENLTLTGGLASSEIGGIGGAVEIHCPGEFRNVVIIGNSAHWGAGGIWSGRSLYLVDSVIKDNNALYQGLSGSTGGLFLEGQCHLQDVLIENNTSANDCGGVCLGSALEGELSSCTITNNHAGRDAGGVYSYDTHVFHSLIMTDCLISNNSAGRNGGGVYINSDLAVVRCTIVNNTAENGAGLYLYYIWDYPSIPALSQNIVFGNNGVGVDCVGCVAVLGCNDVYGNSLSDYRGFASDPNSSGGNFSADPQFCGFSSNDFTLESDSPCAEGMHPTDDDCGRIGAFPIGCSGTATRESTWSYLKSLY